MQIPQVCSLSKSIGSARIILAALAVLLNAQLVLAANSGPFFIGLGDLPGGAFHSVGTDVSADGSTVAGYSQIETGHAAFAFDRTQGLISISHTPEVNSSDLAWGVSGDGSRIVGRRYSYSLGHHEAFIWDKVNGMQALFNLDGSRHFSRAFAISADGARIVGQHYFTNSAEAFIWDAVDGLRGLGYIEPMPGGFSWSVAWSVSDDGDRVAGTSSSALGYQAFIWDDNGGMLGLEDLPGGDFHSQAYDISADGTKVVGLSASATGWEAFIWDDTHGMIGLGDLPGGSFNSRAFSVSGDGSIVVGHGHTASGTAAFIWDNANGMRRLKDVLTDLEVDSTGWNLRSARGISADGQTITGFGINPDGNVEAWMARLGDGYAVSAAAAITDFLPGIDEDQDGFYETYQFDIRADADLTFGSAKVFIKVLSLATGKHWWTPNPIPVTGTSTDDAVAFSFDHTDFVNDISGKTSLDFSVEVWDETQSALLAAVTELVGEPIQAGSARPLTGAVLVEDIGIDLYALTQYDDFYYPENLLTDIKTTVGSETINILLGTGGLIYFSANDGVHGMELWRSDGTAAGTFMPKDINPSDGTSNHIQFPVAMNESIYFWANNGTHGVELWRSDGTESGTVIVRDIHPAGSPAGIGTPLTVINDELFFYADDGTHGKELWKSDGTWAGTVMVKDIHSTGGIIESGRFYVPDPEGAPGVFYFSIDDGTHGGSLWRSDGSEAGTFMVKDLNVAGPGAVKFRDAPGLFGNFFLFYVFDLNTGAELWKSDGTAAGTVIVKDINSSGNGLSPFWSWASFENAGRLCFPASDGVHGWELFCSDGTAEGTVMIKDINPAGDGVRSSFPSILTSTNGTLYLYGNDGIHGWEVWKSDGTPEGTMLLKDIHPANDNTLYHYRHAVQFNGFLYFNADDGTHGQELWRTDGTENGTAMVKDLYPFLHSRIDKFVEINGSLYIVANQSGGSNKLWKGITSARFMLLVDKEGTGYGKIKSDLPGIDCGTNCIEALDEGLGLRLTATPSNGSTFNGWSGGGCENESSECPLTMNTDITVSAHFELKTYTITPITSGGGGAFPLDTTRANHGEGKIFNIIPDAGYHVEDVIVNGVSVGPVNLYNFDAVITDGTIEAVFGLNQPAIDLTAPVGGESWKRGTSHTITWDSTFVDNVRLEYTLDGGNTWVEIVASTPAGTGSYDWVIAAAASRDYKIKISDAADASVNDASYNAFTIYPVEKGDTNGDGSVDLNDLILVLQALTSSPRPTHIFTETAIRGNSKLGLEDSLYILQRAAGLR